MPQRPDQPLPMVDAALAYARKGWAVLPLQRRGKAPSTSHGVKDATTDPDQIRQWWRRYPEANIGLAVPPGFLVLDLDSHNALQRLRALDLALPTTTSSTTGRGHHFWYRTGGTPLPSRVALFPDIDVKAPGGYIVAPPSVHPSGAIYQWEEPLRAASIAEAPEWLVSRLQETARSRSRGKRDWTTTISEPVREGERNQRLAEVTGYLFHVLPGDLAAELAYCWANVKLRPPLGPDEVLRTINSIAGREFRQRTETP